MGNLPDINLVGTARRDLYKNIYTIIKECKWSICFMLRAVVDLVVILVRFLILGKEVSPSSY